MNYLNNMNCFEYDYKLPIPKDCSFITFGMGCFWGAEKRFWNIKGLETTIVGYSGGHTNNPTYEEVCRGDTGHAEVVRVVYKTQKNSLNNLFKVFWESHDPTQINRQGNDIGTQYRSVIFVQNEDELNLALKSKEKFQKILNLSDFGIIKTEIKIVKDFFFAESYHQKYLYKNPNGYCGLNGLGLTFK